MTFASVASIAAPIVGGLIGGASSPSLPSAPAPLYGGQVSTFGGPISGYNGPLSAYNGSVSAAAPGAVSAASGGGQSTSYMGMQGHWTPQGFVPDPIINDTSNPNQPGTSAYTGNASFGGGFGNTGSAPSGVPTGMSVADAGWQNAYANQQGIVNQVSQAAQPLYAKTLAEQNAINYAPLTAAAQAASGAYTNSANNATTQAGYYGDAAALEGAQQRNLYGYGNMVANTAMDPQHALYARTQQQLQDQVNAGQAQRGLGTSAVGGSEYNQAMSNFNIDWQNQQLARQVQGMSAMAQGSQAGAHQGQLMGADLAAQQGSLDSVPGYMMNAASLPIQTQQYIAGQPAANASGYAANMSNLQGMYSNLTGQALPYLNQGAGAQQQAFNQNYATANYNNKQSAGATQAGTQIGSQIGSWLSGMNNPYSVGSGFSTSGDLSAPPSMSGNTTASWAL